MRFRNTAHVALEFELGGVRHQVPVGGSCEVEDRVAYAVPLYGLPLVEEAETAPEPAAEPAAEPYTHEQLRQLEDARFQVPKNATRKTLHELCDRFDLGRPPGEMSNKELARRLAVKLEEIRASVRAEQEQLDES